MKKTDVRKEMLFTNMDEIFEPKSAFSDMRLKNKWRIVEIETAEYNSRTLTCENTTPPDITFNPNLKGWYRIYLDMPKGKVTLKLSSDETYFTHESSVNSHWNYMEESLWRCADMTGESIILTAQRIAIPTLYILSAIRFVPMTDKEVEDWLHEEKRKDTKRIYATDDMDNKLRYLNVQKPIDWCGAVLNLEHSDVEWLSIEELRGFNGGKLPVNIKELAFPSEITERYERNMKCDENFNYDEILKEVVDCGHRKGIKMCVSFRMGLWEIGFPHDGYGYNNEFYIENPQWRCIDRNGDEIAALSYAYPEVQDYVIDMLVNMAKSGCDAVELMSHRGVPYLLFEPPVAERFKAMYGEYPYELSLDEPRLNKLHCEIMTEFARKIRKTLDDNFGKNKVGFHIRSLYSLADSKAVGIDVEQWAKEGLITANISYPRRFHENIKADIWQDGKNRIDLYKYTKCVRSDDGADWSGSIINVRMDFKELPPYENSRGELVGPTDGKARVEEWMELEKKYGIRNYFEILPRMMCPDEYKKRAMELYQYGADGISLWDTYNRYPVKYQWQMARRLGHKDELANFPDEDKTYCRFFRYNKLAGKDVRRYTPSWGG